MSEIREFKTESKRLLDLMINSIYTNKEIFLRELISNASDAIDKHHYLSLTDDKLERGRDYAIIVEADKENRTLTIKDNGIGMTKDELISSVGAGDSLIAGFIAGIEKGMDYTDPSECSLNRKRVCRPQIPISNRGKEISISIVKYADKILGKGEMNEEMSMKILQMFKYLSSKDVFEQYYQLMLSKRLLFKSYYLQCEEMILKRLREECGNSYTTRLEEMVRDVETGKTWYERLNDHMKSEGFKSQYGMVVINSVSWPVCPSITCTQMPTQIQQGEECMRQWFIEKNPRKKLDFNEILSIL